MKFIFADSLDMVDPGFDFINDRFSKGREIYWDDCYPHEMLDPIPYDGMLVSRGIVGDGGVKGKYSDSQAMRFKREGVRKFLRLNEAKHQDMSIFGDCGAFTYVKEDVPPYTPADTAEFYDQCGFTHGCSVDHIIFDFDDSLLGLAGGSAEARRRSDITLENARNFLRESKVAGQFRPLGVIQGWSPASMADAARQLVDMGYDYLALGGMVPLKSNQIKQCLQSIRDVVPASTELHILGFAKADDIHEFIPFNISSFDTTSPLIRAFKDARNNFWLANDKGALDYFCSIRIPQALENPKLKRMVREGRACTDDLVTLEARALDGLRAYAKRKLDIDACMKAILEYNSIFTTGLPLKEAAALPAMVQLQERYRTVLDRRPWDDCACNICRSAGIEVIIFRGSNRNKRRGMHNLSVFNTVVQNLSRNSGEPA